MAAQKGGTSRSECSVARHISRESCEKTVKADLVPQRLARRLHWGELDNFLAVSRERSSRDVVDRNEKEHHETVA